MQECTKNTLEVRGDLIGLLDEQVRAHFAAYNPRDFVVLHGNNVSYGVIKFATNSDKERAKSLSGTEINGKVFALNNR